MPMHTIYAVYTVTGMTCRHCASAVTGELSKVDGVTDVAVHLATGSRPTQITIASAIELSPHLVEAAVTRAGYQLVD